MKKRKIRIDRLLLVIALALALVALVVLLVLALPKFFNKPENNDQPTSQNTVETNDAVTVKLIDYDVYPDQNDELGFGFVIAHFQFEGKENISYDLSDLQTDEKIGLNDISSYVKKAEEKGYTLSDLGFVYTVEAQSPVTDCFLFVPFTKGKNFTLYEVGGSSFNFDIEKNIKDLSLLKKNSEEDVIVTKEINMSVSESFMLRNIKHNGEYPIDGVPSTIQYFGFKLNVNSIGSDHVKIETAEFIPSGEEETFQAFDESYSSDLCENLIGRELKNGSNGGLFFSAYYSFVDETSYDGTLRIKLSNSNEWLELSTTLK